MHVLSPHIGQTPALLLFVPQDRNVLVSPRLSFLGTDFVELSGFESLLQLIAAPIVKLVRMLLDAPAVNRGTTFHPVTGRP